MKILYTNGDSISWGSELKDRTNRFSTLLAKEKGLIDFNVSSSGISNDRIFRNTLRDVCKFLNSEPIYNEELGYVKVDEMFVLISFTAPTRFDYFDGDVFVKEQLWTHRDKWGKIDEEHLTDSKYIIHQTHLAPSLLRIFQQIISLTSLFKSNNIPYLFVNAFFEYDIDEISITNKDIHFDKVSKQFDDVNDYFGLLDLYKHIPQSFKDINLTKYLKGFKDDSMFEERGHLSSIGHLEIAKLLKDKIEINKLI